MSLYKDKKYFVEQQFKKPLFFAYPEISTVTYAPPADELGMEVVTITFCDGSCKRVDVTADSNAAIMRDVLKNLD